MVAIRLGRRWRFSASRRSIASTRGSVRSGVATRVGSRNAGISIGSRRYLGFVFGGDDRDPCILLVLEPTATWSISSADGRPSWIRLTFKRPLRTRPMPERLPMAETPGGANAGTGDRGTQGRGLGPGAATPYVTPRSPSFSTARTAARPLADRPARNGGHHPGHRLECRDRAAEIAHLRGARSWLPCPSRWPWSRVGGWLVAGRACARCG